MDPKEENATKGYLFSSFYSNLRHLPQLTTGVGAIPSPLHAQLKVKSIYLMSVVPSVPKLASMEADGAPFTPIPPSLLRFTDM